MFYYSVLSQVINTVMTVLLECTKYTLIVLLQCIAIICQFINPDGFWKLIKSIRTHPVDAEISDGSYRYLANCVKIMNIGINKFNAFASDHKPLHVLRIQQEATYICISHDTIRIILNLTLTYHNFISM